jgi:hypothetical protein
MDADDPFLGEFEALRGYIDRTRTGRAPAALKAALDSLQESIPLILEAWQGEDEAAARRALWDLRLEAAKVFPYDAEDAHETLRRLDVYLEPMTARTVRDTGTQDGGTAALRAIVAELATLNTLLAQLVGVPRPAVRA